MTSDRRPLWQPFSESSSDQPLTEEHPLPPVQRSPFQEPAAPPQPAVPQQRTAASRSVGIAFTAAG
ncbi:hypothetical protein ACGFX4_40700 [Kitasatospora sp. NPDC048365]|uniref:hypothetical protein n=1 Tax=Kitasatospora sp. NPDC048365 TaxID=3364050 RepID=UPI003713A693